MGNGAASSAQSKRVDARVRRGGTGLNGGKTRGGGHEMVTARDDGATGDAGGVYHTHGGETAR